MFNLFTGLLKIVPFREKNLWKSHNIFAMALFAPILILSSCSSSIFNLMAHMQVKNPKVMTEQECLDYARANLREGIQDIYVIPCEPNDSAREEAMTDYIYMEERVFDADEVEFDAMDTTLTCRWSRYNLLFNHDSISRYLLHTENAKLLNECLQAYKPLSLSDSGKKYPITFLLGLSPDNGKMSLTPDDINQLYDTWEGRCRIVVVVTNPLVSWGLPHGKRVKYKLSPYKREEHSTMATISYSFPK